MDQNYSDVTKNPQSVFYNALSSGSVCFPMPLMYNPTYSFMHSPFLPMHHPMLSNHSLQDNHLLSNSDILTSNALSKTDDLNTRTLAFIQSRYSMAGKCFPPPRSKSMGKYCITPPSIMDPDCSKLSESVFGLRNSSDSNGSSVLPTLTSTCSATSPTSGGYTDKESYLSSPSTEVEEPDSSGKCSTDVLEQKVIPRWTCDSSQPPVCPLCNRTISLQDLNDHYHLELDRFHEAVRKKEFMIADETSQEQITSMRLQSYHDMERKCPEFRRENFLRVRASRINRLGGCGPKQKRQCFEDSRSPWKLQRMPPLCSPKQENISDDVPHSGHQSMLMLELTVQQLAQRAENRAEINAESFPSENRHLSSYQSSLQPTGETFNEDQNKLDLADSSCNGFNNLDMGSSNYGDSHQRPNPENPSDENPCSSVDIKCHVCLELYKTPVVSVCCWHVHCERCWLKALGSKRVCPQCESITSPSDLRRIHL